MATRKGNKTNGANGKAARARIKAALAKAASRAFSDVFNSVFPLAARETPNGTTKHFKLWFLDAMRTCLERYEEAR